MATNFDVDVEYLVACILIYAMTYIFVSNFSKATRYSFPLQISSIQAIQKQHKCKVSNAS